MYMYVWSVILEMLCPLYKACCDLFLFVLSSRYSVLVRLCTVTWMMAGPPSQRLLPPSGPKTHFRSLDHAGGDALNTGPVNTGADQLKASPQTTLKGDQSFKDCCEMKGTSHVCACCLCCLILTSCHNPPPAVFVFCLIFFFPMLGKVTLWFSW